MVTTQKMTSNKRPTLEEAQEDHENQVKVVNKTLKEIGNSKEKKHKGDEHLKSQKHSQE